SQMPPVFTQQYAQEQVIEEHRRAADAERLANIQRAKDHVIGYGWAKSGEAPTVFEFQGGFKYPHFVFTPESLADLDLSSADDVPQYFHLYNPVICTWTKAKLGHVVTLKEPGDRIFVKGLNVSDCVDFDTLLANSSKKNGGFHMRHHLTQERAHVR
ncbi:hypothetical protein FPV67DRAFT_1401177, partial [Lyophyllum atratum]